MQEFEISKHALEQMVYRNISVQIVESVIRQPQQVITEGNKRVCQSVINFDDGEYLVRVILSIQADPQKVITVYRTSKISKYYES